MNTNGKNLIISSDASLEDIEAGIRQVVSGIRYKLRPVPRLKSKGALGLEAAVIQLVGTWVNSTEESLCHSYQDGSPESFKEMCQSMYGICVLAMVDKICTNSKENVTRSAAMGAAVSSIESLRTLDLDNSFKSRYFGIPCILRPKYDREFSMPVYNGEEVVDAATFLKIMKRVFQHTISGEGRYKRFDQIYGVADVSNVMWEMFKNTHDHGRQDQLGNDLSSNFRSLIIQQQDLTTEYLKTWLGKNPTAAQKNFCNHLSSQKRQNSHILDISVVDFGRGFVELAKKKTGLIDNKAVFLKCLEPGWSRLPKFNRGSGLTKVIEKVSKHKGWVRIRSGDLLLEKSFSTEGKNRVSLDDIKTMESPVIGTSFHISIPLNELDQ